MTVHISHAVADVHGSDFLRSVRDLLSTDEGAPAFDHLTVDTVLKNGVPALQISAGAFSPSLHECRLDNTLSGGAAVRQAATPELRNTAILAQLRDHIAMQAARRQAVQAMGGRDPLPSTDPMTIPTDHLHVDAAMAAAARLADRSLDQTLRDALHRVHGGASQYAGGQHLDTRHGSVAETASAGDGPTPGAPRHPAEPDPATIRTVSTPIAIVRNGTPVATLRGRGIRFATSAPQAVVASLPGMRLDTVARLHPVLDASIIETATLVGDPSGGNPDMPAALQIRLVPAPLAWHEAMALASA